MTRRRFVAVAVASAGALLASACGASAGPAAKTETKPAAASPAATTAPPPAIIGGQPSPSPVASPVAQPAASPSPAAAPAPARAPLATGKTIEIVFSHIWATPPGASEAQKHPAELLVDAFNARRTGVTVVNRVDSTDYFEIFQKAQAEMAAGKPPALMATPWASILFADASLGIISLEEIGGSEVSQVLSTIRPEALNLVKLNNQTKGMPFALSCPVIYYNNDILKQAGVAPAELFKDWDAFAELAPRVKAVTNAPLMGVGTNADWPAQSMIQNAGGRVLSDDNQPVMDSPEAVAGMKVVADLNRNGFWQNATTQENNAAFRAGSMAFFMGSIASLGGLRSGVTFDLGTSPFPLHPGRPRRMSSGGSFIACYARDKEQQQGAWEFIKFVASREGAEIWMKTGYLNSTTFELPLVPGQEAAYAQYREGLTRETSWPGRRGGEAQKVWGTYVTRIWSNDLSPEEGTRLAKAELQSILASG